MRAIILTAFGSTDHFRLAELPRPEPRRGEVRIRIHATSFNPSDFQWRQSAENPGTLPLILGSDVAGVVEVLGSGVTAFAPGDGDIQSPAIAEVGGLSVETVQRARCNYSKAAD